MCCIVLLCKYVAENKKKKSNRTSNLLLTFVYPVRTSYTELLTDLNIWLLLSICDVHK